MKLLILVLRRIEVPPFLVRVFCPDHTSRFNRSKTLNKTIGRMDIAALQGMFPWYSSPLCMYLLFACLHCSLVESPEQTVIFIFLFSEKKKYDKIVAGGGAAAAAAATGLQSLPSFKNISQLNQY